MLQTAQVHLQANSFRLTFDLPAEVEIVIRGGLTWEFDPCLPPSWAAAVIPAAWDHLHIVVEPNGSEERVKPRLTITLPSLPLTVDISAFGMTRRENFHVDGIIHRLVCQDPLLPFLAIGGDPLATPG